MVLQPRGAAEQIVGRERRRRPSQVTWCGEGCFDSHRRVNSTVGHRRYGSIGAHNQTGYEAESIVRTRNPFALPKAFH